MQALNLPKTDLKIVRRANRLKVFDVLRRKYVCLTPEEWVRQHFIHFLINEKGFPAATIANEMTIHLGDTTKRCDTVVFSAGTTQPLIICEYKSPKIEITQKVFDQIARYNIQLRVRWLIVSNGLQHYCCQIDYEKGEYRFIPDIPDFQTVTSEKEQSGQ